MTPEHKALVALLESVRQELEEYEDVATGESYNNPKLNAAIESLSAQSAQPQAGEAVAWLTEWKRDGQDWVNAHANEVTAVDEARRWAGKVTPLYASPQPANPAQVTDEALIERCVEIARDHLEIDGDGESSFVRFDSIDATVRAILAAIGAGGQAVAVPLNPDMPAQEMRLHMGEMTAQEMRTARAAIRWANSSLFQPHPADERVVEALREAADRFEEIRVILIEHLEEPQRTAFWKAVNGREFCRHALAQEGRQNG